MNTDDTGITEDAIQEEFDSRLETLEAEKYLNSLVRVPIDIEDAIKAQLRNSCE